MRKKSNSFHPRLHLTSRGAISPQSSAGRRSFLSSSQNSDSLCGDNHGGGSSAHSASSFLDSPPNNQPCRSSSRPSGPCSFWQSWGVANPNLILQLSSTIRLSQD